MVLIPGQFDTIHLTKDGLVLATISVVSTKAFTKTLMIIAKSSSRTVTTFRISITSKNIISWRTFFQRTVGTTVSNITFTSNMFICVPRSRICFCKGWCKSTFCHANTTSRAIIGANCSFATHTIIIGEAITFSRFTITNTFHWAFFRWMGIIGCDWIGSPCQTFRTGAKWAVMASPGRISVRAFVTSAFVCIDFWRKKDENNC